MHGPETGVGGTRKFTGNFARKLGGGGAEAAAPHVRARRGLGVVVVGRTVGRREVAGIDCPSTGFSLTSQRRAQGLGKFRSWGIVVTPARPEAASFSSRNLDLKAPRGVNGRLRVRQYMGVHENPLVCVCVCVSARACLWFPRESAWMYLRLVGLLQNLFVSAPVLCVRVSPPAVYPRLFVSLPVCVFP